MAEPFGNRLGTLTLDELQAFLDGAIEEGLTWEAKGARGDEAPRRETVRNALCGFANAIGGSLILGAVQEQGVWRLPGVEIPGGEASTWVSSIAAGLSPVPRVNVRPLQIAGGRTVAVVAVEPIAEPPCMADGAIYERVSGQTLPVTDPVVLRALFARGEVARTRAEEDSRRVATSMFHQPPLRLRAAPGAYLCVAFAPTGLPSNLTSRVFAESFSRQLHELVQEMPTGPLTTSVEHARLTRDYVECRIAGLDLAWALRVYTSGAVGAVCIDRDDDTWPDESTIVERLEAGWSVGVQALEALGASGSMHVTLHSRSPYWRPTNIATFEITRWADLGAASEEHIASIRREIQREKGRPGWEPEPSPP